MAALTSGRRGEEELKMPLRIWICEKHIASGNAERKEKTH